MINTLTRHLPWMLVLVSLLAGCERQSTPPASGGSSSDSGANGAASSATTAAPAQPAGDPAARPSADDLEKLRGLVQDKTGGAASGALPPGHPPIPGGASSAGSASAAAPLSAGAADTLEYDAPEDWQKQQPANPARRAQFGLPRAEGDPEDGLLVLSYFGKSQGGPIDANLQRWAMMFTTAEGKPVADSDVVRRESEVNGLKVWSIDVSGRYADAMSRPSQPGPTAEDFRLLGAIVETPDGKWFFKATGPAATMAKHHDAFMKMLQTVRHKEP
ncbi:MAG: hypothetical protein AB7Q17_03730 [Phycisphaerae bacterium]